MTEQETQTLSSALPEGFIDNLASDVGKSADDLRTRIDQFGSLENVVKSYVHAEKRMGNAITVPGEGATALEISNYRKAIGAPETSEGYAIPEGADARTASILESVRAAADSNHMTASQWEATSKAIAESRKATQDSIESAWKQGLSEMSENQRAMAERGRSQLITAEAADFLAESGLWSDPRFHRTLAEMGATAAQGPVSADGGQVRGATSSHADIDAKIAELRQSEDYQAGPRVGGAGYVAIKDQISELYKLKEA